MGNRPPAVAGSFYPSEKHALRNVVQEYLGEARASFSRSEVWPKALIVPHAGYMYSGAVAGRGFARIEPGAHVIGRVLLLGPSHHVTFDGVAVPSHEAFETPLGSVLIDAEARKRALALPFVRTLDEAHHWEHSLEVQLPFLQETLGQFALLPVAIGNASPDEVRTLLEELWGSDETLVVISSDLSHHHDYETAKRMDQATSRAIEQLEPGQIGRDDACGRTGIRALLEEARRRRLTPRTLDLRSSGDTAGTHDEVVGYGAWSFTASRSGAP